MAIALVQTAHQSGAANTTLTATLGANATAGNCLVVCASFANGASLTSVTLGGSADHWASAVANITTYGGAIWVDPNCAGGSTSVVVTFNTACSASFQVFEFSGVASSSPVDKTAINKGTTTTAPSSGATATTTNANEVWVGLIGYTHSGGLTVTGPSSPWINEAQIVNTNSANFGMMAGYQVTSSTGAATYSGTFSTSSTDWCAAAATLLPGAVSGTATVTGGWSLTAGGHSKGTATLAAGGVVAAVGRARAVAALTAGTSLAGLARTKAPVTLAAASSLAGLARTRSPATLAAAGSVAGLVRVKPVVSLAAAAVVVAPARIKAGASLAGLGSVSALSAFPGGAIISAGSSVSGSTEIVWTSGLAMGVTVGGHVRTRPVVLLAVSGGLDEHAILTQAATLGMSATVVPLGHNRAIVTLHPAAAVSAAGGPAGGAVLAAGGSLASLARVRPHATIAPSWGVLAGFGFAGFATFAIGSSLAVPGERIRAPVVLAVSGSLSTTEIEQIVNYWRRFGRAPGRLSRSGGVMA